jgi:hypothetical protein
MGEFLVGDAPLARGELPRRLIGQAMTGESTGTDQS